MQSFLVYPATRVILFLLLILFLSLSFPHREVLLRFISGKHTAHCLIKPRIGKRAWRALLGFIVPPVIYWRSWQEFGLELIFDVAPDPSPVQAHKHTLRNNRYFPLQGSETLTRLGWPRPWTLLNARRGSISTAPRYVLSSPSCRSYWVKCFTASSFPRFPSALLS